MAWPSSLSQQTDLQATAPSGPPTASRYGGRTSLKQYRQGRSRWGGRSLLTFSSEFFAVTSLHFIHACVISRLHSHAALTAHRNRPARLSSHSPLLPASCSTAAAAHSPTCCLSASRLFDCRCAKVPCCSRLSSSCSSTSAWIACQPPPSTWKKRLGRGRLETRLVCSCL